MRASIPFDTHAYVKKLVAAGVPERQAEVQAEALAEIALANLATKDDLKQGLDSLEQRIESRLSALELRMTLRFGAMLAAAVAIVVALVKLL